MLHTTPPFLIVPEAGETIVNSVIYGAMKLALAAFAMSFTVGCSREGTNGPKAPATPAPLVGPQRTERREGIISVLKAKKESVLLCVGSPTEQEFDSIQLTLEVGERGEVIRAETAPSRNDAMAQCLVKELKTLTFPAGRRAVVTVPLNMLTLPE